MYSKSALLALNDTSLDSVYTLLIFNDTSMNNVTALLALNWWFVPVQKIIRSNFRRMGWKSYDKLTMTQWSNLTKCGDFHHSLPRGRHISSIVAAALILILDKNPQLQIWPHHRSDTACQPSGFFMSGNRE